MLRDCLVCSQSFKAPTKFVRYCPKCQRRLKRGSLLLPTGDEIRHTIKKVGLARYG